MPDAAPPKDLPYPELIVILRDEFGDKAPFTDEVRAAMDQRLKELQPHRSLFVLTRGERYILGIGEGAI